MNKHKKEEEKRQTPIVDGDARPDMPIDPKDESRREKDVQKDKREKFETERMSDQNSLEDFKDAKKA